MHYCTGDRTNVYHIKQNGGGGAGAGRLGGGSLWYSMVYMYI